MLTSILQEKGKRVIGKITGSNACLLLPGGHAVPVKRSRIPTILEQKSIIRMAAASPTDCLVCEIMSIHAENHFIESQKLLKPHLTIITNVRKDHVEAMGRTENAIAEHFCLDIVNGAVIFAFKNQHRDLFEKCARSKNGSFLGVKAGFSKPLLKSLPDLGTRTYSENLDLVYAVCKYLEIEDRIIIKGLNNVSADESFHVHIIQEKKKTVYCVDAFGANDPESTLRVITKIREILPPEAGCSAGVLSLRADRGDRTLQWIQQLKNERNHPFKEIFILGRHGRIVRRVLKRGHLIKETNSGMIMQRITEVLDDHSVVVGIGNKKGLGCDLAAYWERAGVDARV